MSDDPATAPSDGRRRVCVFTATRAEYGLLHPILSAIRQAPDLDLRLVVAGAHLAPSHGRTIREIEHDGIPVAARIVSLLDDATSVGTSYSMALTQQGVAAALEDIRPDMLVVLGDRYEAFAAAAAAMVARVPIVHLHGGEVTEGAIDEAIRHSITKMAHLHLVAAEPFRRRVLQLGEDPARVHVVGAPGLDNIRTARLMSRQELAQSLGWDPGPSYLLVTHHPVTLQPGGAADEMESVLSAVEQSRAHRALITAPNADPEGADMRAHIERFVMTDPERFHLVPSLGRIRYLSAVSHAAAVVGNSSSGLIEAPFIGTPTVNVGSRQAGRPRAASVVDCGTTSDAIQAAIATTDDMMTAASDLYGDGHTAPRVVELLRSTPLEGLLLKRFHDVELPHE